MWTWIYYVVLNDYDCYVFILKVPDMILWCCANMINREVLYVVFCDLSDFCELRQILNSSNIKYKFICDYRFEWTLIVIKIQLENRNH